MSSWVIAWRNLWRNRRRTSVTLATVAISTLILVLFSGLMFGMLQGTIANLTDTQFGQVQVHAMDYVKRPSMYRAITNPQAILAWADARNIHAVPRSLGAGLVGKEAKSSGARIWGVDPARERAAFKLAHHVRQGAFLDEGDPYGVVIGAKLARSIRADLGDELIVVVAAADGSIGNELWSVRGILGSMGEQIDRGAVIVGNRAFEEIFVSEGRIHEIAVTTRPGPTAAGPALTLLDPDVLADEIRSVAAPVDDVATWKQLMPTMAELVAMSSQYNQIIALIFFLAAAIGILNTMLMAAYERIPEMGLVRALGASPTRVFMEMTLEGLMLSALGAFIGGFLGGLATLYFQSHGIDLSSLTGQIEMNGVLWDATWRAHFDLANVVFLPLSLMPIAFLAGLYPAITAARVVPVQALRRIT